KPPRGNTAGMSSAVQRAIQIAAGELGVREYAQNRVNRPYNINDAWCASFATWAWRQAGINVPWTNKNAVLSVWSDAQRMGLADNSAGARPGDLVILNSGGHIGMVVARNGNTITTIEGNSSDAVQQRTYNLGASGMVGVVHPPG
uniref:CHAP domain-containing protein n=1 Tax=Nocardia amamiensis TaxID=404578 RepID=UPI000B0D15B3